jgi:NADH:ubiquinone oxidoreductase subunit F (NADH-binding)
LLDGKLGKNMTESIVLRNYGVIDPENIDENIARKGFKALDKALTTLTPEKVIQEIENSGLRKREGKGLPVADELNLARGKSSHKKYVVCNTTEWDPASSINKKIIESDPLSIIEGMSIVAYAIGAVSGYIYCQGGNSLASSRIKNAISQAEERNYLGENILGSGFSFTIEVKEGAEDFVCIEETALIASLEDKKARSCTKPPLPAQSGIHNCPTIINSVETFANIAPIILNGSEWFRAIGTEKSKGTKIFQITSGAENGKLIEVSMGTSLTEVIKEEGTSIDTQSLKAIHLGGPLGCALFQEQLDTTLDFESMEVLGIVMGQGSISLVEQSTDIARLVQSFLEFTHKESCGKCVPCRIGSKRMVEILSRISEGQEKENDVESLREIALAMKDSALCTLGQNIPNPVLSFIDHFK